MKIFKNTKLLKVLLLASAITAFVFSVKLATQVYQIPVVKADVGLGRNCIPNKGNCPAGYTNLYDALNNNKISLVGISSADFSTSFNLTYKDPKLKNTMCIKNDITKIIPVAYSDKFGTAGEVVTGFDKGLNMKDFTGYQGKGYGLPRGCGPTQNVSEFKFDKGASFTDKYTFQACCPTGYIHVMSYSVIPNSAGTTVLPVSGEDSVIRSFIFQQDASSRCCKIKGGRSAGDVDFPVQFNVITGQCEYLSGKTYSPINYGAEPKPIYSASDGILGEGLGTAQPALKNGVLAGSTSICPTGSSCALVNKAAGDINTFPNKSNKGAEQAMISANNLAADPTRTCNRCFDANEPVDIIPENEVDPAKKKLAICNPNGTFTSVPLINNSVDQTIAVYVKSDTQNQGAAKACLESGGIYIAIGCVDTTPVGIITGLIRISLGVMGGVALIQLILVGIALQSGDEKRITEARTQLVATLTGVAVLVFSILILRILGVNVLDVLPVGRV